MEKNTYNTNFEVINILSSLQESGLIESAVIKLINVQTNDRDVLYWKILVFLVGTRMISQDLEVAKQLLARIPEDDEPRFQMLRGLLAMADSGGSDICMLQRAESCFLKASSEPTKEIWYCLGVCRYKLVVAKCDFNIETGYRLMSPEFSNAAKRIRAFYFAGGAEKIREWITLLKSSCCNLYESYQLGSVEALIEIAKCVEAFNHLNLLVSLIRDPKDKMCKFLTKELLDLGMNSKICPEFRHSCDCYRLAAGKGLAEGWKLLHNRNLSKCTSEPSPSCRVDENTILEAWTIRHNISQAYYLSQMYNQADALPHYIAGVVLECGFCGFEPNLTIALGEFEKALSAKSDVLGFVKELSKDHLTHLGYRYGLECEVLKYLEYEIERDKNDRILCDRISLGKYKSQDHELMMRRFRWWYGLRYVLARCPSSNLNDRRHFFESSQKVNVSTRERLAQILLDSGSPEGLFIMSALGLYETPLHIKANARLDNQLDWLRYSTVYNGGCSDGNYLIACKLLGERDDLLRLGRLTASKEEAYNAEIVRRLEMASMWGHMKAEFDILMAARYGYINGCYKIEIPKSPEEIANGFLRLRDRGYTKAGYEYAFCQYDQFGVKCDVKDCYDWIRAAAYVYHGYGRGRTIYNKIWSYPTYWEDIDRGCQEI